MLKLLDFINIYADQGINAFPSPWWTGQWKQNLDTVNFSCYLNTDVNI